MIAWSHSIVARDTQPSTFCCAAAVIEGGEVVASSTRRAGADLAALFERGWLWAVALPDGGRVRSTYGCRPMAADVTFEVLSQAPGAVILLAPR